MLIKQIDALVCLTMLNLPLRHSRVVMW